MNKVIQVKSDYYIAWKSANTIIPYYQLVHDNTHGVLKLGDGSSNFLTLPPINRGINFFELTSTTNATDISFSDAMQFKLALTENTTISLPTNINLGQEGTIMIEQDVTGGRTIAWNSVFKFINIDSTVTTAGEVNVYSYTVYSATSIALTYMGHFTA